MRLLIILIMAVIFYLGTTCISLAEGRPEDVLHERTLRGKSSSVNSEAPIKPRIDSTVDKNPPPSPISEHKTEGQRILALILTAFGYRPDPAITRGNSSSQKEPASQQKTAPPSK